MCVKDRVEDYLYRLVAELITSHGILVDTCGSYYLGFIEAWIEIAQLLVKLCPSISPPQNALLCFDIHDSINAAILNSMRGNVAVPSIVARRMLEEASAWFAGIRRPYQDQSLPKVYAQFLSKELSREGVELLTDSLKKLIKGIYNFLSAFTHPEGKGILPYMGIWSKPPMVDVEPGLCKNIARPLIAITMAILLVVTPIILAHGHGDIKKRFSMILEMLFSIDLDEPKESIEALKALVEVVSRAVALSMSSGYG